MSLRIFLVPSLIPYPTNSAILIRPCSPIIGLDYQCISCEAVKETVANNIHYDLVIGRTFGRCCTIESNNCSLLDVNNTAAVHFCSTGGIKCAHYIDLAVAMKAIVTSCSANLLSSSTLVGEQVVTPWMVNTTLKIDPAQNKMALSELSW